jgi:DNA polymerase epsilon subunit 1
VGSRAGANASSKASAAAIATDPLSYLIDFREHDVPYTVRASIDLDLRVGAWYTVTPEYGSECCQVIARARGDGPFVLRFCAER